MENGGGLVSLPAVQRGMEMIRDEVPGGDCFRERNATSRAFFESFGSSPVVHLSTHAFLLGENQVPALQFSDRQVYIPDIYRYGQEIGRASCRERVCQYV